MVEELDQENGWKAFEIHSINDKRLDIPLNYYGNKYSRYKNK